MAEQFDFRALGPLEVRLGGRPSPHLAPMRRRLLAVLLSRAGRQVTVDELSDAVWSGEPPRSAANTLLVHVHRLRQALGDPERVRRDPGGYRIAVTTDEFDVLRFDELYDLARSQRADDRPEAAAESLERALDLWRGEPYADIEPSRQITAAVERLTERRLIARQALQESLLDSGRHHEVVASLTELADAHPYVERISALLMIALYRAGRQAEALEVYRTRRAVLVESLGVEPGSLLRRVHEAVLRSDDRLEDVATSTLDRRWEAVPPRTVEAAPAAVPRELPRVPDRLVGREAELAALDRLAESEPAPLALITGMGGVGKTALALHWAHRWADRFPDGQLFINLRGDDADSALRPIDALKALLSSLGVPAAGIPIEADQAAARFRTRTGDRRMLLVLDNAAAAEQVRPLLPGGPGCLVLVTSRHRLAGLTVRDGGTPLSLGPLSHADAQDLLADLLDVPAARAADLAELCGRLPLALRIAAADLADRPDLDIAAYSKRLAASDRLSSLQIDGADAAVRAVFDSAYEAVPEAARRLFRLLGTAPSPDIAAAAAAHLADTDPEETDRNLERLVAAHLVECHRPGRYRLHDLLRIYAAERAEAEVPRTGRDAAIERLLGWYMSGADACHKCLYQSLTRLEPEPGAVPLELDPAEAKTWLKEEHTNLVAAVLHAAEHGPRRVAWRLNDALRGYMWLGVHGEDAMRMGRAALTAARAEGDPEGEAAAELSLTTALMRTNRPVQAIEHGRRAAELAAEAGFLSCLSAAEQNVANACASLGRLEEAIVHGEAAMSANQKAGNPQTADLAVLGVVHYHRGEIETGIECFERAAEAAAETGGYAFKVNLIANLALGHLMRGTTDRAQAYMDEVFETMRREGGIGLPSSFHALAARIHLAVGRVERAFEHANRAVENLSEFSDHRLEAIAMHSLGLALDARGDHREAVARFARAIELTADDVAYYRTQATLGRAEAYLHLGETDPARRDAEAALETARECGFALLEARARELLAST